MGRAAALTLGLLIVLAACGIGEAADDGAVTISMTTSPSPTTMVANTTTTGDPCPGEPFIIEERNERFRPDCEYRTGDFFVPMTITVGDTSWLNLPVDDPRVSVVGFDDDRDGTTDAKLVFLRFGDGPEPIDTTKEIDAEVTQWAAWSHVTEPRTVTVGGHEAVTVDFDTGEELGIAPEREECTPGGLIEAVGDIWLFQLVVVDGLPVRQYGVPACRQSRVWAVKVDDLMVTIVAAVRDDARFDELMPVLQVFLDNNVTFGDAGG